jgi:NADH-quinone oxidoreductase subunit E
MSGNEVDVREVPDLSWVRRSTPMQKGPGPRSMLSWKMELSERFPPRPEQLIPALQYVQAQAGYLPREAIAAVARQLRVSEAKVYGVASFYSLFHLKPRGRNQITVCRGTACHVRGSARILGELERTLGIQAGGTTPDMLFSLETVACLGSCALAPVVVKDKVYGRQTAASARDLVESVRSPKPLKMRKNSRKRSGRN